MTMDPKSLGHYMLPLDLPIVNLDCKEAFNGLTDQEKLYTYHLSQASWYGGLIVLVQTSPESPAIFTLVHDLFRSTGIKELKDIAIGQCDFTDDEWKAFMVYACGLFSDMGNYKGYGDTKVIPGLPLDKFEALIKKGKFLGHENAEQAIKKFDEVKDKIYSLSDEEKQLGLGKNGISTYFSSNCTAEDAELINRFMKKEGLEAYITRCFKTVKGGVTNYEIRSASSAVDTDSNPSDDQVHCFEDCKIRCTRGDYSPLLQRVSESLLKAKDCASNETEQKMLECYVESFTDGSLAAHKEGSRHWIKDKGPIVETYIGFIETYRDPVGMRGEFEGFVSVVNRQMSVKFTTLVEQATRLLTLLPWPKEYEKDEFLKPDFTSLDTITFAGSGIPAGINIPNYDEIRQSEGFKNVSLGNVIQASFKDTKIPFLGEDDKQNLIKNMAASFEVQVGLHELLGHGSGKLFQKKEDGTTNYPSDLRNPLTKELIESVYEPGETYDSVFTTLGSAYEECRAESVGVLLCLDKDVIKIFGYEGSEADEVIYANWLTMALFGVKSLEMYQPKTEKWMQSHSQAAFVILQVLLEAGDDFVTVTETVGTDGKPDLLIKMDRTKMDTVGRKAMSDFLLKLQVYKSTADIKEAREMFDKYSAVNNEGKHPWANWRDIVLEKKKPRKIMGQPNLVLNDEGKVELKTYEPSVEGFIQSWIGRYSDLSIYNDLETCRQKDKPFFNGGQ